MNTVRLLRSRQVAMPLCRNCCAKQSSQRTISSQTLLATTRRSTRASTRPSHSWNEISLKERAYATHASYSTSSLSANELLEQLQDQYATARDEFEIATEETEKKTVYAADDRAAARKELETLKEMYENALRGQHGEEVKTRVGSRLRELENALTALEESALED